MLESTIDTVVFKKKYRISVLSPPLIMLIRDLNGCETHAPRVYRSLDSSTTFSIPKLAIILFSVNFRISHI